MTDQQQEPRIEQALSQRLARLASLPVESAGVEARLRAALAQESAGPRIAQPRRRLSWWRPAVGLAAALLLTVLLTLVFTVGSSRTVIAAPAEMAQLHQMVTSAPAGMNTPVSTIEEANQVIAAQWAQAPTVPQIPAEHVHACCIANLQARKLVCVLLKQGQKPVTLVVANASDVAPAQGQAIERGGQRFVVHQMGQVQMVMTQKSGRYVCVMGEVDQEQLLTIAQGLNFEQ